MPLNSNKNGRKKKDVSLQESVLIFPLKNLKWTLRTYSNLPKVEFKFLNIFLKFKFTVELSTNFSEKFDGTKKVAVKGQWTIEMINR